MFLTDAQLRSELERCEYCEEKPCKKACPCDCSPADFIMAAKTGKASDYKRAAGIILSSNPLGGICGDVCPDYHCMQACSREGFDTPINIPAVQSTIIKKARDLNALPLFEPSHPNGKRIAIFGSGPSGIGAAITLIQKGYDCTVFESEDHIGGQVNLIPDERLNRATLLSDLDFLRKAFGLNVSLKSNPQPAELSKQFDALVLATGLSEPIHLSIPGDEHAVYGLDPLKHPEKYSFTGKRIAIVGGAIAADIALLACIKGARHVEMIVLEAFSEMPLTPVEKKGLMDRGVHFTNRMRIAEIVHDGRQLSGVKLRPVHLPEGESFHPGKIVDEAGAGELFRPFDLVFLAVGNRPGFRPEQFSGLENIYFCGDMSNGPTTVVEAVAAGKNAALMIDAKLSKTSVPDIPKPTKSQCPVFGWKRYPIPLQTDFFGRRIESPFLLSAAPPTDGYEQVKKAYNAGWSGVIMKTAFDGLDIHIPGEYMFVFDPLTYANCDNVSEHPLERVCQEISLLTQEFPEKLTMASTGGPVSGNDAQDKAVWQSNTQKLEKAGAMGIEYSLSCPQGGDGTHGDIVAQDAVLSAKIVDWVMQISDPEIPKLFKLTGAVTAIYPIISAIKAVLDSYPGKKAGVTLANTFPCLAFRENEEPEPKPGQWSEGIIVGMSGAGVLPISYLSIARAGKMGVEISGNGGPMNYLAAVNFLALGASTVQFCTIAEKYGLGIIDELKMGLSHYLEAKGLASVADLIGIAQPEPITDFMSLPPQSRVSALKEELCVHCGNCSRCPYLAITMEIPKASPSFPTPIGNPGSSLSSFPTPIGNPLTKSITTLDEKKIPVIDPDKCVGCSLCVQKCFAGALYMKEKPQTNLENA